MSFFGNFFSTDAEEMPDFWNPIVSHEDLKAALEQSAIKPILIFKHSTRCIISKTVLRNFEKELQDAKQLPFEPYFLDLLNHRELSNKIADDLGVAHQSPQAILIQEGKAVYDASHDRISLSAIPQNSHQ